VCNWQFTVIFTHVCCVSFNKVSVSVSVLCAHLAEVVSVAAAERFLSDRLRCISGLLLQARQRRPATAGHLDVTVSLVVAPPSDVPSPSPVLNNQVYYFVLGLFCQTLLKQHYTNAYWYRAYTYLL